MVGFKFLAIISKTLYIRLICSRGCQFFAVCQGGDLGFCYFVVHFNCFIGHNLFNSDLTSSSQAIFLVALASISASMVSSIDTKAIAMVSFFVGGTVPIWVLLNTSYS